MCVVDTFMVTTSNNMQERNTVEHYHTVRDMKNLTFSVVYPTGYLLIATCRSMHAHVDN